MDKNQNTDALFVMLRICNVKVGMEAGNGKRFQNPWFYLVGCVYNG